MTSHAELGEDLPPPAGRVRRADRPVSAWEELLDRLDRATHHREPVTSALVAELADLLLAAMHDGTADRELDPGDSARWLGSLLRAHRMEQDEHETTPDAALSTLRVIVTRWLHPGRLDAVPPPLDAPL